MRSFVEKMSFAVLSCAALACGSSHPTTPEYPALPEHGAGPVDGTGVVMAHATPPAGGPVADIHLPAIHRTDVDGLEVNSVHITQLPAVSIRFVVRAGRRDEPEALPGMARFVTEMLKLGTRSKDAAQLAEAFEYLGADFNVGSDADTCTVSITALAEHFPVVMGLLGEVVAQPRFDARELERFKRREEDRLTMAEQDPSYLARREFFARAFGSHPYGRIDATHASVAALSVRALGEWHGEHFRRGNAFVVVAGSVEPEVVVSEARRVFARLSRAAVTPNTAAEFPEVARTQREIVVVHRPGSVQSVLALGNLSRVTRRDGAYIPLSVINQVLGGGAASRLFMDLRERRSLTYGAYSGFDELLYGMRFRASASVANAVTEAALSGFMEHLERIVSEPPSNDEIDAARTNIANAFPLTIDSIGRVAWLVTQLRVQGLPDDYWDGYRTAVRAVTADQAFEAARANIHPDTGLMVVVGDAEVVTEPLRHYGDVVVVATDGRELARHARIQ